MAEAVVDIRECDFSGLNLSGKVQGGTADGARYLPSGHQRD